MSTAYRTEPAIKWDALWEKLPKGLSEAVTSDTTAEARCLSDGSNYLWAYKNSIGIDFERTGRNDPSGILDAIEKAHKVRAISEHDDDFWTEEDRKGFAEEELKDYTENWATYLAAESDIREVFKATVEEAKSFGLPVPTTYPDGQPLD